MSSMTRFPLAAAVLIVLPVACVAQDMMGITPSRSVAVTDDASLRDAMESWATLRQSDGQSFSSYARFLIAHPGWPGEAGLRKAAERNLHADSEDSALVARYYARYPATTATGALRYAEALDATGRRDDARTVARTAWTMGVLSPEDERRLLARFSGALTQDDQDARMERLLSARATAVAARQIALTSPIRQPFYDTRLAMQLKSVDASSKSASLGDRARGDAGFLADRAVWLRTTGQEQAARALLAAPRSLTAPPVEPERWFELLQSVARSSASDGQYQTAYDIARQVDDAYGPRVAVRDRPFAERDLYTNLTWLAGTMALKLGRPSDAVEVFDRYARAAKSPQTQAKGLYWAARAADQANKTGKAHDFYERAAAFFDQFYGQLAAERLGRTPAIPAVSTSIEISRNQREAFNNQEIVRAAQLLAGDHQTQSLFVRQIAQAAQTDADHFLAAELAVRMARPDLGVMVGRSAGVNGLRDYVRTGFPVVPVPAEASSDWSIVHAIARQESQFDRAALSRAGARGLMQLMPATARDVSGKLGLAYDPGALMTDTSYNIRLGDWLFGRLMDRYRGSYVLSVAAYNAGAGNVNKWLAANGDPRSGTDVLQWIEAIPFAETRSYVQRVLENAVVYDMLDPKRARITSRTPLSAYLGKSYPG